MNCEYIYAGILVKIEILGDP